MNDGVFERPTAQDEAAHSGDMIAENIARLKAIFPQVLTDGKIDFEVLRQLLGDEVETGEERYGLNWKGKKAARAFALTPSLGTLRPAREDSVDWENTQNIVIEGDNMEVLKLLRRSYAGKVKLIYIDPPYNTGKDFVYPDDYADSLANYERLTGQRDADGVALTTNKEASGRFHTDWLNMMYPRLMLAKDLLTEDGLIFVSISDTESPNLRIILDSVFGEESFIGNIVWNSTKSVTNTALISVSHTHTLVYARVRGYFTEHRHHFRLQEDGSGFSNPDNDPRGPWKADPFQVGGERPNQLYEITNPNTGQTYRPLPGCSWKNEYSRFKELLADGRIVFGASGEAGPQRKRFLSEAEERGKVSKTIWDDVGTTTNGTQLVKSIFDGEGVFDNPKPIMLLQRIIELGTVNPSDTTVLDFFAGSGTSGHAVMAQNAADGGKRRYILVQLPEPLDPENSNQKTAADFCDRLGKPRNIAELTKERLRRAGAKLKAENPGKDFDTGFRVYKLATSNLRPWQPDAHNLAQSLLDAVDNILPGRTEEDLLTELLLKTGIDLTLPTETREIAGKTVHALGGGTLIVCLAAVADDEAEPLAHGIADWRRELAPPAATAFWFKDAGFASAAAKANLVAILKQRVAAADITRIAAI